MDHKLIRVRVECVRSVESLEPSKRTAEIGVRFGLPLFGGKTQIVEPTGIELGPGRLVAIVGPSGSGKTSVLHSIESRFTRAVSVQHIDFPKTSALVDKIVPASSLSEAISILTRCGLGEPALWVRPYDHLSEGEKFRAKLARAIALHRDQVDSTPLLCDEFGSLLHRRCAKAISFGVRKLVTQYQLSLVVACSHEDLLKDLQPDQVLRLTGRGHSKVTEPAVKQGRGFSLKRRLHITQGKRRDYEEFASMHYRATDELGFVDKVFVMREGRSGDTLGIVVYAHAPLELSLRNRATAGRFTRNPRKLNRQLRILRRLVIHPDIRGCGLGHDFVRKTLPKVGTRFVECLAGLGAFNPVFERAGMTRVGAYEPPAKTVAAINALAVMGVDPRGRDFPAMVCRRRRVREIVARVVYDWYAGTTGGGEARVAKQSPQRLALTFRGLIGSSPVYYLWDKKGQFPLTEEKSVLQ